MRCAEPVLCAAACALCCAFVAVAHPVAMIRADVLFVEQGIGVAITLPEHSHIESPVADGARERQWRIVDALAEHLHVYDVRGERLSPLSASVGDGDANRALIRYGADDLVEVVTLRLAPEASPALHGAQLLLQTPANQAVQIAAGGGAATLPLRAGADEPRAREGLPSAFVDVSTSGFAIEIMIPLPLLETWMPVDRASPAALTANEASALAAPVRELLQSRIAVVADGEPATLAFDDVACIDPAGDEIATSGAYWGSGVRARAFVERQSLIESLVIDWRLFNSAVARGRVHLIADGESVEREVSRATPGFSWHISPK